MSDICNTRGKMRKASTVLFEKTGVTTAVQRPRSRWILSKWVCGTDSNGVVQGPAMDFCEHNNNGAMKDDKAFDQLVYSKFFIADLV